MWFLRYFRESQCDLRVHNRRFRGVSNAFKEASRGFRNVLEISEGFKGASEVSNG